MCADTASLAVIEICLIIAILTLTYALNSAESGADAAFDAFFVVKYRTGNLP